MKWILTTVNAIPITWSRCNARAIKAELKEFHSCVLIMYPRVGRIANIVVSQREIWQKSIRFLFPITSGAPSKLRNEYIFANFSNESSNRGSTSSIFSWKSITFNWLAIHLRVKLSHNLYQWILCSRERWLWLSRSQCCIPMNLDWPHTDSSNHRVYLM